MEKLFLLVQLHPIASALWLGTAGLFLVTRYLCRRRIHFLTPHEVVEYMNRRQAILFDLQPEASYRAGHILHAHSVPASNDCVNSIRTRLQQIQDRPVVLYCAHGTASQQVAQQLLAKPVDASISVLRGGVSAWSALGLPIVTA